MLPDKHSAHATGQRIKSSHVDPLRKNLKKYGRIKHDKTKFHLHLGVQTCHIQRSFYIFIINNFGMFGVSISVRTAAGILEK